MQQLRRCVPHPCTQSHQHLAPHPGDMTLQAFRNNKLVKKLDADFHNQKPLADNEAAELYSPVRTPTGAHRRAPAHARSPKPLLSVQAARPSRMRTTRERRSLLSAPAARSEAALSRWRSRR